MGMQDQGQASLGTMLADTNSLGMATSSALSVDENTSIADSFVGARNYNDAGRWAVSATCRPPVYGQRP